MRRLSVRMAARLLLKSSTRAAAAVVYSRLPLPAQALVRGLASGGTGRSMALFGVRVWTVFALKIQLKSIVISPV